MQPWKVSPWSGGCKVSKAKAESSHPVGGFCPLLLAHIPERAALPRLLGLSRVPLPTQHLSSPGLGPDSSDPGEQIAPAGSLALLGGGGVTSTAGMPT